MKKTNLKDTITTISKERKEIVAKVRHKMEKSAESLNTSLDNLYTSFPEDSRNAIAIKSAKVAVSKLLRDLIKTNDKVKIEKLRNKLNYQLNKVQEIVETKKIPKRFKTKYTDNIAEFRKLLSYHLRISKRQTNIKSLQGYATITNISDEQLKTIKTKISSEKKFNKTWEEKLKARSVTAKKNDAKKEIVKEELVKTEIIEEKVITPTKEDENKKIQETIMKSVEANLATEVNNYIKEQETKKATDKVVELPKEKQIVTASEDKNPVDKYPTRKSLKVVDREEIKVSLAEDIKTEDLDDDLFEKFPNSPEDFINLLKEQFGNLKEKFKKNGFVTKASAKSAATCMLAISVLVSGSPARIVNANFSDNSLNEDNHDFDGPVRVTKSEYIPLSEAEKSLEFSTPINEFVKLQNFTEKLTTDHNRIGDINFRKPRFSPFEPTISLEGMSQVVRERELLTMAQLDVLLDVMCDKDSIGTTYFENRDDALSYLYHYRERKNEEKMLIIMLREGLTYEQLDTICAGIIAEGGNNYDETYRVASVLYNRAHCIDYIGRYGTNLYNQFTADSQFVVYENGMYAQYLGRIGLDGYHGAVDMLYSRRPSIDYLNFKGRFASIDGEQFCESGNKYYNHMEANEKLESSYVQVIAEELRTNEPNQILTPPTASYR